MTISATQQGRDLHISVEGIEQPFVVRPLPGRAGMQMTDTYLEGAVGKAGRIELTDALAMALDGAQLVGEQWMPRQEAERANENRMGLELSITETESVALAAFFWQTILGINGVQNYIDGGEGVAGQVKALGALVLRLGISAPQTSPSSALESLIQLQASTPPTSTPSGGVNNAKRPRDRLPKLKKRSRA